MLGVGAAGREEPSTGEFLARWLAHARGRVRATTYDGYESLVRLHALPSLADIHPESSQRSTVSVAIPRVSGEK